VQLLQLSSIFLFGEQLYTVIVLIISIAGAMMYSRIEIRLLIGFFLITALLVGLVDSLLEYHLENQSFFSLMSIDSQSTNLSEFVSRLLPEHIQETISTGLKSGRIYKDVTILFADIVGFTAYSAGKRPREVIEMLSKLFTAFDKECARQSLFKVYTIGDCYVVMSFIDSRNRRPPREEAHSMLLFGQKMINIIKTVRQKVNFDKLDMRIGIHTGEVYGGVIGLNLVRFDLYGPDMVIANKMESNGTPGKISVSQDTKQLLEGVETENFTFTENCEVSLSSGDRRVKSYFVTTNGMSQPDTKPPYPSVE
jgi:class 3 adenylate cyclase